MSAPSSTRVVFFGATGGVTNAALVHTLKAGYQCTALVRTPEKLRAQLTKQGLDESLIDKHLTIVQGNALDIDAVKKALTANSPSRSSLPTHIVTGLGGSPKLNFDWCHPLHIATLDNPNICETAARTLLQAMREVEAEAGTKQQLQNKPLLIFVSTTGITHGPEDVPLAMRFLYHQMLAVPHADKKKMESLFRADAEKAPEDCSRVFRNVVGVRPTLLSGAAEYTDAAGLDSVKSGTESKPALGYSIKRADVGHWIFENVINETSRRKEVEGEMITLTS